MVRAIQFIIITSGYLISLIVELFFNDKRYDHYKILCGVTQPDDNLSIYYN